MRKTRPHLLPQTRTHTRTPSTRTRPRVQKRKNNNNNQSNEWSEKFFQEVIVLRQRLTQCQNHQWTVFLVSVGLRKSRHLCLQWSTRPKPQSRQQRSLYSHLKVVLFCELLKRGDECTDPTFQNSDHYRPWLWVVLVDQKMINYETHSY